MNSHYTYFISLAASLVIPLALSFDKKVAFFKKWKYLFPALLLVGIFYILWDVWFTSIKIWSFNPDYISGLYIFNLPVEEILFFFVVPYCCVFIYQCIISYFPQLNSSRITNNCLLLIAILLLIAAFIYHQKIYSFVCFGLCGFFILACCLIPALHNYFNSKVFLITYSIIILPLIVVNGILTAIPVVIYNDAENTGLRLYTIPVEDFFYGMLLILANTIIYEWHKKRALRKSHTTLPIGL